MSELTFKHLKIESKGVYVIRVDMDEVYEQLGGLCAEVYEIILRDLLKILDESDHSKFPKRGVVFCMPQMEDNFKW